MPITAVLGALFLVCLLVGLLVAGGLLYRKRIQKPRLLLEPVEFTKANEVLETSIHPRLEQRLEKCAPSEDGKQASLSVYEVSYSLFLG